MKKVFKNIVLILSMFIFTQNILANEQIDLKEHFLKKIDKIVLVVESDTLSKSQRNNEIINILEPTFDFELMAKLSLGKIWKTISNENKKRFVKLYVQRMKDSYSSKVDGYGGEKVEVTKINQIKSNRIALITDLVSDDKTLEIIYKFYKPKKAKLDKDLWLIYDAEISGVSILKTDKAQFREFLKTKSISELMDAFSKKS